MGVWFLAATFPDTLGDREDCSPSLEARTSVSNIDNPSTDKMTIWMWFIGVTQSLRMFYYRYTTRYANSGNGTHEAKYDHTKMD